MDFDNRKKKYTLGNIVLMIPFEETTRGQI